MASYVWGVQVAFNAFFMVYNSVLLRYFGRPVIVLDSLEVGRRKLRQLGGQMRDRREGSKLVGLVEPLLGGRVICKGR